MTLQQRLAKAIQINDVGSSLLPNDEFMQGMNQGWADCHARYKPIMEAMMKCVKALKLSREWISDDDPEWPIPNKIDKALASLTAILDKMEGE